MSTAWKGVVALAVVLALVGGVLIGANLSQPAAAQQGGGGGGGPRYTVVHTEGTNLIVVDNKVNNIYFYTIEPEGKPGDDLILRGSADLNQVGKDKITPKLIHPRKKKDGEK
jgi:hypothetical protein